MTSKPLAPSSRTLVRRTFLASTTASVVAAVAACERTNSDDRNTVSTGPGSADAGPNTPANTTGSSIAGSHPSTGESSKTHSRSSSESTASADAGLPDASYVEAGSPDADTNLTSHEQTSSSVETSSEQTSEEPIPADDACFEGGGTDGGTTDDAGAGVLCSTNTDNGNHCHALRVPPSVATAGVLEATYTLEDGGTGHTHTVTLSAYDFTYLEFGIPITRLSSDEAGHSHPCLITCEPSIVP